MSTLAKKDKDRRDGPVTEIDLVDKAYTTFADIPQVFQLTHLTRLTLSHNKIKSVPANIAELVNLEILTLWNNQIEELPTSISAMPRLKVLNCGMNRLWNLPRGFGAFPALEVLDLTYNNLSEKGLFGNFFIMETLRALYLGDNDFETLPSDIRNLKNLQILVLRDNDLIYLPKEIGELVRLRELHIQGNRLTILPPEIGRLDLVGSKQVFRMENNPWVPAIAHHLQNGTASVLEYLRTEEGRYLYERHAFAGGAPPPKTNDKTKKISRQHKQPGC